MNSVRMADCSRVCGLDQRFFPLPIRDEHYDDVPVMATTWSPTPEELAILIAGGKVVVRIMGVEPPPMQVGAEL